MWCGIISIFPEMFDGFLHHGMVSQAQKKGLLSCALFNPRSFTHDKHRTVDDRPFGGGPGMVMKAEPLRQAIETAQANAPTSAKRIYLAPDGEMLSAGMAREIANERSLILIAGRYEGIDQRLVDSHVDQTISIGDYVLTGGELAVMVLLDAVIRFVPGILGDEASYQEDAFAKENSGLLDCPHYTRPSTFNGAQVPQVLLSGDHAAIARWRRKQKLGKTWQLRPDILEAIKLSTEDAVLLQEFKQEHKR